MKEMQYRKLNKRDLFVGQTIFAFNYSLETTIVDIGIIIEQLKEKEILLHFEYEYKIRWVRKEFLSYKSECVLLQNSTYKVLE